MDNVMKETISEALLRRAVIDDHMNELDAIPSKEKLAEMYTFSDRHEARMNALFKSENLRVSRRIFFLAMKRVALFIIVVGTILFGVLLTNPTVRAAVIETIVEWFEKFTRYSYNSDAQKEENADWHFGYMPNGYRLSDTYVLGAATYIVFVNEAASEITFFFSAADDASLGIDNEHFTFQAIYEQDIEYHVYESASDEYPSQIVWIRDGYAMNLRGYCSIGELLRMAQSVKIKNIS